jgi:hypothetical protein
MCGCVLGEADAVAFCCGAEVAFVVAETMNQKTRQSRQWFGRG